VGWNAVDEVLVEFLPGSLRFVDLEVDENRIEKKGTFEFQIMLKWYDESYSATFL
jgi:hypothetical protein